jgi:hypothetical protein
LAVPRSLSPDRRAGWLKTRGTAKCRAPDWL